jgi:hypothetical protein
MTLDSIEALRSTFEDGDMVLVEWVDPRTLLRAPWDPWCDTDNIRAVFGASIGLIFDLPDENAVLVQPHEAEIPFGDERDEEHGQILIPYSSIYHIRRLRFGDVSWYPGKCSATDVTEVVARENLPVMPRES